MDSLSNRNRDRLRIIREGFANCDRRIERAKIALQDAHEAYGFWEQALAKLQQDTGMEYLDIPLDIHVSDAVPPKTMLLVGRDGEGRLVHRSFVFADPEQTEL